MSLYLSARKLDITSAESQTAILNEFDAEEQGFHVGDTLSLTWKGLKEPLIVTLDITDSIVQEGQIGFFGDVWDAEKISYGMTIKLELALPSNAVESIRKKINGEALSYEEFALIMKDMANGKLNQVLSTFFVSAGYSPGFNDEEVFLMTKALANSGEQLHFEGIVADKHSIGGVAGKGITPIVIPVVAAFGGLLVPNTSTRAVTSASATTDMLELIMPMAFSKAQLEAMVMKTGAFMVWGGGLDLAPADDKIIEIQKPLAMESIDKFVSSIVAKKIAQGVTHVIFDVPVGIGAKVTEDQFADVKEKFDSICSRVGIHDLVFKRVVDGIDGFGVGPALECREFLRIYEQHPNRSLTLEHDALDIAGHLLELCGRVESGKGFDAAKEILLSGKAEAKLREIIKNQGGDDTITSGMLVIGGLTFEIVADADAKIDSINNKDLFAVARALGNPRIKEAGIYFNQVAGDTVKKGDLVATIYATSEERMRLAKEVWSELQPVKYSK